MDSGGVTKYDAVVSVIRKPPSGRNDFMVNDLIPWFRKRSRLFESLKTEILFDVIKNVAFLSCQRDDILIKEGDQGDCMYIILRGSVSIYRLMEATRILDEDTTTTTSTTTSTTTTSTTTTNNSSTSAAGATTSTADIAVEQTSVTENIRIQLGERVAGLGEPSTFGDVALMSEDCIRTASVIVDEPSDFIVFDRDLYNRSVKSVLKKEFEDKTNFIDRSHYFRSWQPMYRKQLAMAMVKETVPFNSELTKQGNHVDTIYFLLSGEVKVTVDPWMHKTQYPKLLTKTDPTEKIRSQPNNCKQEPNQSSTQTDQSKKRCRPHATEGLDASGKVGRRTASSVVEVCLLGINACVGDIEVLMDLTTYLQTSTCTQRTEVLILEIRHFERLFTRRHPRTVDRMKENLMTRFQFRLASAPPALYNSVPLLHRLLEKVEEYNRRKLSQTAARQLRSWAATVTDEKTAQHSKSAVGSGMFDGFVPLQGALIDLQGPGTVFHHIRQREQARLARMTKGGRIHWGQQGFGSVLTTKRVRFGRSKLVERMDDGVWDRDGVWEEEEDGGDGGEGDATAAVDAIVKNLEERMQEWHLSNKTHALTIRDKPLIAKLHRTQTESLVRQAAGISPPRSMQSMQYPPRSILSMQYPPRSMHTMDRGQLRRSPPSPSLPQRRTMTTTTMKKPIRTEQTVNKKTIHKKVKDMKRRKDGIRSKAAEDKDALDFTRLAQFENDILTRQNDSWV